MGISNSRNFSCKNTDAVCVVNLVLSYSSGNGLSPLLGIYRSTEVLIYILFRSSRST